MAAVTAPAKTLTDGGCASSFPCLCQDSMPVLNRRRTMGKRVIKLTKVEMVDLGSSFIRVSAAKTAMIGNNDLRKRQKKPKGFIVVDELGGQYDDTFIDVKLQIMDYFTVKAVRTVLDQLYEMNPPQYQWFNNFVADNKPRNGKRFLQILVKERQDLAERVMITRLTLYSRWIKKCDNEGMYKEIEEENLKLMRERLLETIVWPSDDHNNTTD